jgi:hypothetical protein
MLGGASAKTRFKYLLSKQPNPSKIGSRMNTENYKILSQSCTKHLKTIYTLVAPFIRTDKEVKEPCVL